MPDAVHSAGLKLNLSANSLPCDITGRTAGLPAETILPTRFPVRILNRETSSTTRTHRLPSPHAVLRGSPISERHVGTRPTDECVLGTECPTFPVVRCNDQHPKAMNLWFPLCCHRAPQLRRAHSPHHNRMEQLATEDRPDSETCICEGHAQKHATAGQQSVAAVRVLQDAPVFDFTALRRTIPRQRDVRGLSSTLFEHSEVTE